MSASTWTDDIRAYYESPHVRSRVAEYCGGTGDDPESLQCAALGGFGGARLLAEPDGAPVALTRADWGALLAEGADVCRSLADRGGTLLQLDVDYVNHGDYGQAYREPERIFACLEPLHVALLARLREYGLQASVLMTGRGYHYTFRAPFGSPLHTALAAAAPVEPSPPPGDDAVAALMNRSHVGAGRLLEHLAHRVLLDVRDRMEVPVTLAEVPPPGGGPFVCVDLTAFGDPLAARYARTAFSANQKAAMLRVAPEQPFVIVLPRGDVAFTDLLPLRRDPAAASDLAREATGALPDVASAPRWIEDYWAGPLARFHREFDSGPQADPTAWSFTYDTVDAKEWPPCIGVALEVPNPLLLKPTYLRSLSLGLWGLGWHPRSIAGLIRSKYERDYGWRGLWKRYDAASRAEFYVRIFCGAAAGGLEATGAFSCASQAGRGLCEDAVCFGEQRQLVAWLGEALERLAGR
jgi:hypothetical protein